MIETECAFLSRDEYRPRIQHMLNKIMKDLNEKRTCTIVEGETTIYLKILRIAEDPPEVADYQVPILRPEFQNMSFDSWDLTTQQVLPFINGVYHVSRIASCADVENSLVKSCVQNLENLTKHPHLGQECLAFVTVDSEFPAPTMYDIFQLYSQMTHGVNLKTLCIRLSPRHKNIDERKLVEFGLKHNLIRTINKFPIFTGSIPNTRQRLYNGHNQLDEICCKTGLSVQKIEELIDNDTNVTVICK